MNVPPITLRPDVAGETDPAGSKTDKQKLTEATRQFEAMLIRQILQQARQTVIKSKFTVHSMAGEIYHDLVNAQMAESMTKSGGLGLATSLEQQLSPRLPVAPPKAANSATERPASHD